MLGGYGFFIIEFAMDDYHSGLPCLHPGDDDHRPDQDHARDAPED